MKSAAAVVMAADGFAGTLEVGEDGESKVRKKPKRSKTTDGGEANGDAGGAAVETSEELGGVKKPKKKKSKVTNEAETDEERARRLDLERRKKKAMALISGLGISQVHT